MGNNFNGRWICDGKLIEITNKNKTFECSLERANIGIKFRNSLIVSEFDEGVEVGGVGAYSPIGDGSSNYALWSDTKRFGLLGSGIARKTYDVNEFIREYSITYYFADNGDSNSINWSVYTFDKVKIEHMKNSDIHKLSWYNVKQEALHGIGIMIDDSLVFAYGSLDCKFDFNRLTLRNIEQTELRVETVKWDSDIIEYSDYIRL